MKVIMKNIKEESITQEEADKIVAEIISLCDKTDSGYIFCTFVENYFEVLTEVFLEIKDKNELFSNSEIRNFIYLCAKLDININKVKTKLIEFYGKEFEAFIHEINSNKEIH